jgi:hypothetical protein
VSFGSVDYPINEVTCGSIMVIASRRNRVKRGCILKRIKVEGTVDEGQEIIVLFRTGALECEGFKSLMALWNKVYKQI